MKSFRNFCLIMGLAVGCFGIGRDFDTSLVLSQAENMFRVTSLFHQFDIADDDDASELEKALQPLRKQINLLRKKSAYSEVEIKNLKREVERARKAILSLKHQDALHRLALENLKDMTKHLELGKQPVKRRLKIGTKLDPKMSLKDLPTNVTWQFQRVVDLDAGSTEHVMKASNGKTEIFVGSRHIRCRLLYTSGNRRVIDTDVVFKFKSKDIYVQGGPLVQGVSSIGFSLQFICPVDGTGTATVGDVAEFIAFENPLKDVEIIR